MYKYFLFTIETNQVQQILQSLSQQQIEHRHGSLLTLSHAIRRKVMSSQKAGLLNDLMTSDWVELRKVVIWLVEHLSNQQTLLVSAAINGLSLIGSVISLPLPERPNDSIKNASNDSDDAMDVSTEPTEYSKLYVGQKLLYLIRSAHSRQKIREEAAHCLGYLAVGDPETFTQRNLDEFVKMLKLVRKISFFVSNFTKNIIHLVVELYICDYN